MVKKKPQLNSKEKEILRALHTHGGSMSTNEISEVTGISYVTVKKYLEKLEKKEIISLEGEEDA